jgi:hypothetical protein
MKGYLLIELARFLDDDDDDDESIDLRGHNLWCGVHNSRSILIGWTFCMEMRGKVMELLSISESSIV